MAKLTMSRFRVLRRIMDGERLVMGMPSGRVYWAVGGEGCTRVARGMINEGLLRHPPAFASSYEVQLSVSSKGLAAYKEVIANGDID
ncbi:hypothetical protein [Citrobacter sp. Marseille-Q6884]|uniref:hypothetical protein n=1 Tax=Citrobacter sp. Marseille-Q6884 TaxID=2956786 RepID=UPI0021B20242|nr:hypothetical protein [Citrobacter sp. Marseille-Q6884]